MGKYKSSQCPNQSVQQKYCHFLPPSNICMCPFYVSWLNLPKNSLNKLFQWVY